MRAQVTKVPNYRAFVIAMLPKLRVLDFQKVRAAEREAAEALVGSSSSAAAASSDAGAGTKRPRTFEPGEAADGDDEAGASKAPKAGPTPEQVAKIKAAIANASSLEEVARLEKALKSGNYEVVAAAAEGAGGEGGEGGGEGGEGAMAEG